MLPFYAGRVKCIYIDPPYNTRSAFEQYDDNLEHSRWLAMMWPRLELLRELLSEYGSIWVSIDDNEAHYSGCRESEQTSLTTSSLTSMLTSTREAACCPKGWKDMLDNPVRHALVQRSGEIQRLTDVPEHLRAQRFLEETLRPATDAAVFAENLSFGAERRAKRMRDNRKTLGRLRMGLGEFVARGPVASFSRIPRRRPARG